jgi:hypothetical protein
MTEPNTQQSHAPTSLAHDEALEYARRAEILATELDRLHREAPHERATIGYANQHLGVNLKLAEVHATLAVRDAVLELLAALLPAPAPAAVFAAAPPETPDNPAGVFAECSVCNGHLYLTSVARSGAVYACDGRGHDRFTRADLGLNAVEEYDHTGHLALFIMTDPEQLEVAAK